jgi:hypothetical protein
MISRNRFPVFLLLLIVAASCLTAAGAEAKPTSGNAALVDSGSFGIFVKGRRVATETFQIHRDEQGSLTHSELKVEHGSTKIGQTTDLYLDPIGNIRSYKWSETSPGKAYAVVEPDNKLLMQHIYKDPGDKPLEQPFLLSPSTVILDDYFFIHRELLVWRYLGAGCHMEEGKLECRLGKTQFPVLIPRQHISTLVYLEYLGLDEVNYKGKKVDLHRFRLDLEEGPWYLWLDNSHHLVRILISSQNTEVLRD